MTRLERLVAVVDVLPNAWGNGTQATICVALTDLRVLTDIADVVRRLITIADGGTDADLWSVMGEIRTAYAKLEEP